MFDKLKEQFEENPLAATAIAAFALTAVANVIKSGTAMRNSRSWARETKRRDRMSK